MTTLRYEGNVKEVKAEEAINKKDLVHMGEGRVGVAINDIDDQAKGHLLVTGSFDGGDITVTAGITANAAVVVTGDPGKKVTGGAAFTGASNTLPNIRADETVSASASAKLTKFTLLG